LLEHLPPGRELAGAYATIAQLEKDAGSFEAAVSWGTRALELAKRVDDRETLAHALNSVGMAQLLAGRPEGRTKLERSLELSEEFDLPEHVARAFVHLVQAAAELREYELADTYLERGLRYVEERGLDIWRSYLRAFGAKIALDRGRWDDAEELASLVFQKRVISTLPRTLALVVRGLVPARRGEPGATTWFDEAARLAEPSDELARLAPIALARAETAWLAGDLDGVAKATDDVFERARESGAPHPLRELTYWRWRAGLDPPRLGDAGSPWAVQMAGDWARAAELWTAIGCPYEAALALADAGDAEAVQRAIDELKGLGATAAIAMLESRRHGPARSGA
jgi:tetratricopeptide (TPR) repeat protein